MDLLETLDPLLESKSETPDYIGFCVVLLWKIFVRLGTFRKQGTE